MSEKLGTNLAEVGADCISRQAAIDEFKCCELTPDGGIDANYAVEFLAQLPSAQPEPKTGKWIMTWNKWFKAELPVCSACNIGSPYKTKFCPNCGAKMEVEHEQT